MGCNNKRIGHHTSLTLVTKDIANAYNTEILKVVPVLQYNEYYL